MRTLEMSQTKNNPQAKASELTQLLYCPFCGHKIVIYKGRPKMKWSITFKCKNGECDFKITHEEYRRGDREEYDKRMIARFNKRVI